MRNMLMMACLLSLATMCGCMTASTPEERAEQLRKAAVQGDESGSAFKMDNPTVFHHELGSLSVTGGRYSKNSPHSTLYVRGAEAGNLLWFDNRVTGFTAEETKTLDDTLKGGK